MSSSSAQPIAGPSNSHAAATVEEIHSDSDGAGSDAEPSAAGVDGAIAPGDSSSKKKKKKKSKAKKLVDKVKSSLPGGEKEIPDEIVARVMEEVAKQPDHDAPEFSEAEVRKQLQAMKLLDFLKGSGSGLDVGGNNKKDIGEFKFWKTQPVTQMGDSVDSEELEGPIDPSKPSSEVRQEPYPLPASFVWSTVDVADPVQLKEVVDLLSANYVEDPDATMRFNYTGQFMDWALKPPGFRPEWHVGVRVGSTKKLVAFISGIPIRNRVRKDAFDSVEINFLVVHKKLRSKRLAPVLIKEVTRRCNLLGIFQAIYTAGVVLPTPVATSRYYHRNLNPPKLIDIGFAALPRNMTMARCIAHYAVPAAPSLPGFREMEEKDLPAVTELLRRYLERFALAPVYDEAEVKHWLWSGRGSGEKPAGSGKWGGQRKGQVVWCYVVEDPETQAITDFASFYSLPSTNIGSVKYPILNAAYTFYYASSAAFSPSSEAGSSTEVASSSKSRNLALGDQLRRLMGDLLVVAKAAEFDVMNTLTMLDNLSFLDHHKFGAGNGYLNYYLYNYRARTLNGGVPDTRRGTSDVAVVML